MPRRRRRMKSRSGRFTNSTITSNQPLNKVASTLGFGAAATSNVSPSAPNIDDVKSKVMDTSKAGFMKRAGGWLKANPWKVGIGAGLAATAGIAAASMFGGDSSGGTDYGQYIDGARKLRRGDGAR